MPNPPEICSREEHPANASVSINSRVFGKLICFREEHPAKALFSIETRLAGREISAKDVHSMKQHSFICEILSGNVMFEREEQ